MIRSFPDPYPDELFYSICARYSDRMRYPRQGMALLELTGGKGHISKVLPNLKKVIDQLPRSDDEFIRQMSINHTIIPYYTPFIQKNRIIAINKRIFENVNNNFYDEGWDIGTIKQPRNQWMRFCSTCAKEDRKEFGECYWHRIHQIFGVEVCPKHKELLVDSKILFSNKSTELFSAEGAINKKNTTANRLNIDERLIKISEDIYWILNQKGRINFQDTAQKKYRYICIQKGLARWSGYIRKKELISVITKYYSTQLLSRLRCNIDEKQLGLWPTRLFISNRNDSINPLYHILLLNALGHRISEFENIPVEYKPFGIGPWPCLNPVCIHYKKLSIQQCHIRCNVLNSKKGPIGVFSCSCGFTYQRRGPDKSNNDIFLKCDKMVAYGKLWDKELTKLWNDKKVNTRSILQKLQVSKRTIQRQAYRLGLHDRNRIKVIVLRKRGKNKDEKKILLYRTRILYLQKNKYLIGREEFKNHSRGVFQYLWRNDRKWVLENIPKKEKREINKKVDWKKRDSELSRKIYIIAKNIRNTNRQKNKISLLMINEYLGHRYIEKNSLLKLPKTVIVVNRICT